MSEPALVPQWYRINEFLAQAKHAPNRVYDAVNFSVIDDTSTVLRQLAHELEEAHRIISIYWDAIDLLSDGPDDGDAAHAHSLIAGVQITADPIAEAYRVRRATAAVVSSVKIGPLATEATKE